MKENLKNDNLMRDIVQQYSPYIYTIIHHVSRCPYPQDLEEATANVFIAFWKSRAKGKFHEERGSIKAYLAAIARREGIRLYRCKYPNREWIPLDEDRLITAISDDPASEIEARETHKAIQTAIDRLPDREIVVRRYFFGESLDDIAEALHISYRAVEGRLYRSRKQLQSLLGGGIDHDVSD